LLDLSTSILIEDLVCWSCVLLIELNWLRSEDVLYNLLMK